MGLMSLDSKPINIFTEMINGFCREDSIMERLIKGGGGGNDDDNGEVIRRLEDEMKKIEVFKRELPLCMLLLQNAILALKQEPIQCNRMENAHQPVLEEFIPLKKETGEQISDTGNCKTDEEDPSRDKKNWMSSVQLWTADNHPTSTANNRNPNPNKPCVLEMQKGDDKRNELVGDDLYDLSKSKAGSKGYVPMVHTYPSLPEFRTKVEKEDVSVPGLSLLIPGIKHPKQDSVSSVLNSKLGSTRVSSSVCNGQTSIQPGHQQPNSRKQRRCWSPELHRRFVDALTQLGGPQVATPKQIRDLMRVDGLTNDEVKSHLQKYRLHTRRVSNSSATSTNDKVNNLAGSWATQDQYSESSKPSSSQSGSPEGPLDFPGLPCGTSTTCGDSMEEEDDEKSESYSWKGHLHRPGKVDA